MRRTYIRDRLGRFARAAWSAGATIMKKIILLGAAPIGDTMRFPSEGEIDADPAVADELIKVGLAKDAKLTGRSKEELRDIATDELVDVAPDATKAEITDAIVEARTQD